MITLNEEIPFGTLTTKSVLIASPFIEITPSVSPPVLSSPPVLPPFPPPLGTVMSIGVSFNVTSTFMVKLPFVGFSGLSGSSGSGFGFSGSSGTISSSKSLISILNKSCELIFPSESASPNVRITGLPVIFSVARIVTVVFIPGRIYTIRASPLPTDSTPEPLVIVIA